MFLQIRPSTASRLRKLFAQVCISSYIDNLAVPKGYVRTKFVSSWFVLPGYGMNEALRMYTTNTMGTNAQGNPKASWHEIFQEPCFYGKRVYL